MSNFDLAAVRRSYERAELHEGSVRSNPTDQLRSWLDEALGAGVPEANAMCLCTASAHGYPSARMLLLRGLDERGLRFFTSYFSRKARDLRENPRAAAVFYWPELERQVRVEGEIDVLSDEESDAYFHSRPRGHQLGAWASEQSDVVESRELLEARMLDYAARFEGEEIPRPHSWGGYLLRPFCIEFWQGRANRLHDRLEYSQTPAGWTIRRLQP